MGKGPTIGIYFTYDKNWLGGVYYLVNLVNTFNCRLAALEDAPNFVIFYSEAAAEFVDLFTYPKVELVKIERPSSVGTYAKSWLSRRNAFLSSKFEAYKIDGLYPINDLPVKNKKPYKMVSWYPDLQHRFYPEYFTKSNLIFREQRLRLLLKHCDTLVVSSEDVHSHFQKFYGAETKNTTVKVLPFVSLVNKDQLLAKEFIFEKYKLAYPYFVVSNQFFRHKDHLTVFRALNELKQQGKTAKVLMTGHMKDPRNPDYIKELKAALVEFDLGDSLELLGVVPRQEQLSLLKYSTAIIQPSLFEGWSTVVEDAKALGASIITSDINIHKEQLGTQGLFFKQSDHEDLASKLGQLMVQPDLASTTFPYEEHIRQFTYAFEKIF